MTATLICILVLILAVWLSTRRRPSPRVDLPRNIQAYTPQPQQGRTSKAIARRNSELTAGTTKRWVRVPKSGLYYPEPSGYPALGDGNIVDAEWVRDEPKRLRG